VLRGIGNSLYDVTYPMGEKDEIPENESFIVPESPFVSNGMDNVKLFEAAREQNITMPGMLIMYGTRDWILNNAMSKNLVYAALAYQTDLKTKGKNIDVRVQVSSFYLYESISKFPIKNFHTRSNLQKKSKWIRVEN
jgi:hypothetical protein